MQEYHVIVDCPQELHVLKNLMEQGKLTEKEYDLEKSNFIHYVRERCNEISLLSRPCIVSGTAVILLLILLYAEKLLFHINTSGY